ncbi:MAG: hypothetical protein LQ352_004079 [Teloschistes flavicans]|nr:MAG: hypothetical protein LQ352_004079 [Teloschistes flavicans]
MSAATQKPLSDLSQTGPIFSYAQAAKGRSPSGPSSISMETASKEDATAGSSKVSTSDKPEGPPASGTRIAKRAASEGRRPRNDKESHGETKSFLRHTPDLSATPAATTPASQAAAQSHLVVSTPSSPEFGVTSASTLPKDDDMFSNANGSSDSTWEKLSQGSQNGSRSHDKTESHKEPTESTAWDEASPASTGLKDAPPPAVNIWTQRIEAKAAKTPLTSNSVGHADTNGITKPFDIGAESKKQDSRRQAKRSFGGLDEKPATAGAKAGMPPSDGWAKEELIGTRPRRVDKANTADRSLASSAVSLPPPGDSRSWPTVDSAQDEDKKKAHERVEKGEKEKTLAAKGHKEKWVPVPYVPTVQFNTPIPPPVRRGARAPRGGRDAGPRIVSSSSDKLRAPSPDATPGSQPPSNDGGKLETVTPRNFPSNARPKRASSTGPASSRDQRRELLLPTPMSLHALGYLHLVLPHENFNPLTERFRALTLVIVTGRMGRVKHMVTRDPLASNEGGKVYSEATIPHAITISHYHSASAVKDDQNVAEVDTVLGVPAMVLSVIQTLQMGMHLPIPLCLRQCPRNLFPIKSVIIRFYTTHNTSHLGTTDPHHDLNRLLIPPQPPDTHMGLIRRRDTGVMSAGPYTTYMEQASIFGMVTMQMEYYFSVDNLCKDLYLRKHMDSQGFVFLSVLAKFNRIRQLTHDLELVRYVCLHSPQIEFRAGPDGCDRLRKREGWQQWILTLEDRDPSVQNEGPSQIQQPIFPPQPLYGGPYSVDDRQITSPRSASNNLSHGSDVSDMTYVPNPPSDPIKNSHDDQDMNVEAPNLDAVTKIAPSLHTLDPMDSVPPEPYPPMQNTFSDEQVDLLMIVVRKSPSQAAHTSPPFHSASSRTFSNGSIDGRTISSELTALDGSLKQLSVSGDEASDVTEGRAASSSRGPMHIGSPPRWAASNVSPPVFWVKNKDTPIDSLPEGVTHEPYHVFRRNALQQRGVTPSGVCPSDLKLLYEFWSHFLVRNFNTRMYHEFRQIAFDDANNRQSTVGVEKLIQYYDESILSPKDGVSDQIASDFLSLVGNEGQSQERPAFDRLRAAWRNGAFNIQNRKKLDSIMDPALKAEIES